MSKLRAAIWVLLAALAGCAGHSPVPEDRFYQVAMAAAPAGPAAPVFNGGLSVDYVTADPLRSGRAVLYRDIKKPLELHRYHYEFWVDQPPKMVHRALVHYLRGSGVAASVQIGSRRSDAAYRLLVQLQHFEQVLGAGQPIVEIGLEATLYSERSGALVWTATYQQQQASRSRDMHATAEAMQQALQLIFQSMVADFSALELTP